MNKHFSKEDTQMIKKYVGRCPTPAVIREMQINITMKCHFTLTRMALAKQNIVQRWPGCGGFKPRSLLLRV
jgi:hypothetical protein